MAENNLIFFTSIAAFFVGLAKAGLGALGGLATPILILPVPDPRTAVGLGAVLFFIGDVGAIIYYARSARFSILLQLLPISALGMLLAFIVGKIIPSGLYLLCITILSGLAFVLLLLEYRPNKASRHSRTRHLLLLSSGFVAGFTTVLGNASGIFMNLYLRAKNLPKQNFVATMALFYFLINGIKLLMYYFYWESLDLSVLAELLPYSLWIFGFLVVGLIIGIFVIHKMTEKIFSFFVVLASLVIFVLLLWRTVEYFLTP